MPVGIIASNMDEPDDRLETTVKQVQGQVHKGCYLVNKKLLPIKAFYFCFLAAVGSLLPFLTIYLKQLNLTTEETGIMYGCMPFFGFFIRPVICAVADRWRKHKLTLMLCSVLTGLFFLLVLVVPGRVKPELVVHSELNCNQYDSYFKDCITDEEKLSQQQSCHYGLSVYEARLLNLTKGNQTDVDCKVTCAESASFVNNNVEVCITNRIEEFEKHCDGVHILNGSFSFQLQSISCVFDREDRRPTIIKENNCKYYDLKSLSYNSLEYWQLLCDKEGTFHCEMKCENSSSEACQPHDDEFDATFGWLFLITFIANMAFAPVISLVDTATFDTLGKDSNKFGEQRLWGAVGFALLAVIPMFVMYIMAEKGSTVDYSICFYIFAIFCFLSAAVAYHINLSSNIKCSSMFSNILALIKVAEVTVFFLVLTFLGITTGAIESFLFWFLGDLGAPPIVFGLCIVINCVFEVPLLFVSGLLIKKVGTAVCLHLAILAVAVRFFCYSFITNPWLVLLVEPLQGITFGVMWPAATTKASLITPRGMSATIQGLVGGIYFGIGKGIGSIVMGIQIKHIGARWSFRLIAFVSLAVLLLDVLLNQLCFKSKVPAPLKQDDKPEDQSSNSQPLLVVDGDSCLDRNSDHLDSPSARNAQ